MQTNNVSYSSSATISAAFSATAGSATKAQEIKALVGMALEVGDVFLEKLGSKLGLSPAEINGAQAVMHAAACDRMGTAQNLKEAALGYLNQQNPIDRSALEREMKEIAENSAKMGDQIQNNSDENKKDKKDVKGKNFFEVIAVALGKMLGEKAAKMMESLNKMETAGGNSPTTPKPEIKPDANGNYTEAQKQQLHEQDQATSKEQAQQAQDFSKAQAQFSADTSTYQMVSNLVNNAIKTIGEGMSTLARKG